MIPSPSSRDLSKQTAWRSVQKKNKEKSVALLASARESLLTYRQLAKIDTEDGGVIRFEFGGCKVQNLPSFAEFWNETARSASTLR